MLIFNTDPTSAIEQTTQISAAINGGCGWIQLWLSDNDEQNKSVAKSVIDICKQHDIILTIANDVKLVEDTKVHGIFLDQTHTPEAIEIRRQFGPHAIIGISSTSADEIKRLYNLADIDYVSIPETHNKYNLQNLLSEMSEKRLTLPVVVSYSDVPDAEQINEALSLGVRGIAVSIPGADAGQIEQTIKQTLAILN